MVLIGHRTLAETILGQEHPEVAGILTGMSSACADLGEYARAEVLLRRVLAIRENRALEIYRRSRESGDVSIAAVKENLATLLAQKGQFGEAESLQREALAEYERVLGSDHVRAAAARSNLGRLLRRS